MKKKTKSKVLKLLKQNYLLIIILCLYLIISSIFNSTCIFRYITKVACPACGATRAYLSLLNLDFKKAFYYHPLFPILLPMVIYLMFSKKPLFGSQVKQYVFLSIFLIILLGVWILRLFFLKNSEFYIDINSIFM